MTIDAVNRLIMLWDKHRLPTKQILWVEFEEYLKWENFFKNFGSGNVFFEPLQEHTPELICIKAIINGYHIYIVQY